MTLGLEKLPKEYKEALQNLSEEDQKDLLEVLLNEFPDDYDLTTNTKLEIPDFLALMKDLDLKIESEEGGLIIKCFWEDEYVGFAKVCLDSQSVVLEEFLTSNYKTTYDQDLPREMKEEFKLMDKVKQPGLGTNFLVKIFKYLLENENIDQVSLVPSKGSVRFYKKVLSILYNNGLIYFVSNDIPGESNCAYNIFLESKLLDLDDKSH